MQPVLDPVGLADLVEAHLPRPGSISVAGLVCELDAVVCQDRVDSIGRGFQKVFEKLPGGSTVSLSHELGNGEFTRAVDGHELKKSALHRPHLGDFDVDEADGIAPELGTLWSVALDIGQTGDAMTLKASV